ncbi:ANKRD50 [Symbiodinium sp. KB8]|nr:ANKRD50 [Symbiodinium sp. KB8]
MLHVWSLAGEELSLVPAAEVSDARTLKRRLFYQGFPSPYRQQLLSEGRLLDDADTLDSITDVQLILQPFIQASQEQADELHSAVASWGSICDVEAILQRPQDPDLGSLSGNRPLLAACRRGHIDLVRLLLEAGADKDLADRDGNTPLIVASLTGEMKTAQLLVESGAKKDATDCFGSTALILASAEGHAEIVRLLLEAKAAKDLADYSGSTALMRASSSGRASAVRVLLEAGVDKARADHDGNTALIVASFHGRVDVVHLLLKYGSGADSNFVDSVDFLGRTALLDASRLGHVEIVRLLLDARADKEVEDNRGNSALNLAKSHGHTEIARMLAESGQDAVSELPGGGRGSLVDMTRPAGKELCKALCKGDAPGVQAMLDKKADPNFDFVDGDSATVTPLILACRNYWESRWPRNIFDFDREFSWEPVVNSNLEVLKTLMAAPSIDVNAGAYSYGWHGSHVRMTPLGMAIIGEIDTGNCRHSLTADLPLAAPRSEILKLLVKDPRTDLEESYFELYEGGGKVGCGALMLLDTEVDDVQIDYQAAMILMQAGALMTESWVERLGDIDNHIAKVKAAIPAKEAEVKEMLERRAARAAEEAAEREAEAEEEAAEVPQEEAKPADEEEEEEETEKAYEKKEDGSIVWQGVTFVNDMKHPERFSYDDTMKMEPKLLQNRLDGLGEVKTWSDTVKSGSNVFKTPAAFPPNFCRTAVTLPVLHSEGSHP